MFEIKLRPLLLSPFPSCLLFSVSLPNTLPSPFSLLLLNSSLLLSPLFFLLHHQNEQFVWITGSLSRLTYSDIPPLVLLAELLLASSIHIIIWCPMWFHWKKKERHCLSGAALACNPTQWSFQPTSDCLIGIHCCVCQECWQYIAVICIKQEGAQIPLLFHVSLPLLHPKEISECDSQTRNYKRKENHISWPCAVLR